MNENIFITGMHRSGTTWIAAILSKSNHFILKDEEIFRPNQPIQSTPIDKWYLYINHDNQEKYNTFISNIVNNKYYYLSSLKKVKGLRNIFHVSKNKAHSIFRRNFEKCNPIMFVEPIGLLSAPWFVDKFNCKCLVIIRHPASIISSMKKLGWGFDFNIFSTQVDLIDKYFYDFKYDITNPPDKNDSIGCGILLWKMLYSVVAIYENLYDNWVFVKYENLAKNPMNGFKSLCRKMRLDYSEKVEDRIEELSSTNNPIELPLGKSEDNKRNSIKLINIWKTRLDKDEIIHIRKEVEAYSKRWYNDSDWLID